MLETMAMANLTLSFDDALLRKAREAALREKTSVNALVCDYLSRYVDARSRRIQALDAFDAVADRTTYAAWAKHASVC